MTQNLDDLDRLCAEKIMGYVKCQDLHGNDVFAPADHDPKEVALFHNRILHWQPTRKIEQAFEVFEKLNLNMELSYSRRHKNYGVRLSDEAYNPRQVCDSAALCIVLACLKAKGIEFNNKGVTNG